MKVCKVCSGEVDPDPDPDPRDLLKFCFKQLLCNLWIGFILIVEVHIDNVYDICPRNVDLDLFI